MITIVVRAKRDTSHKTRNVYDNDSRDRLTNVMRLRRFAHYIFQAKSIEFDIEIVASCQVVAAGKNARVAPTCQDFSDVALSIKSKVLHGVGP